MADQVELLAGGRVYRGWTSFVVTRAMDAAASVFSLTITERWPGQEQEWPLLPGTECEVRLGGDTVIVGYVDVYRPAFDADSHTTTVQGRDRTSDLVDCSADHAPDEWRNITALALAAKLAEPFGISVASDADPGEPFRVVKLQQGETAFEAIDRHCRMRKLLAMADGAGGLLITRAGRRRAAVSLVQGENIKSASGTLDYSERFSRYTVKGQAPFSPETDTESEAHIVGTATDGGVARYRPMVLIAEAGSTTAAARDRAEWEANIRIGRATSATITVQGWRQRPGGALWAPNTLVGVRAPWLKIAGDMLVREVTYQRDNSGGTQTILGLVSPQAYSPAPAAGEKAKAGANHGEGSDLWMTAIDG